MVIIGSLISLLVLIIIPAVSLGEPFSLAGDGTDEINKEGITKGRLIGCALIGLLANGLMISIFEVYTSHGC